jgi:phosphoglycolate phosphatase-like HAD superfamily hydrolase
MVGDQITDIDAARQAGTHSIGYANKPGKAETLANAIITSLGPLALALRARPLPN